MAEFNTDKLGTPDIRLSGFQLWVHGRYGEYWLNITAHCGGEGSSVWISGSIIHLPELDAWLTGIERLYKALDGQAILNCMEPNLAITLKAESRGNIHMKVEITPNQFTQNHSFHFEIDQSYLAGLIQDCRSILEKYPA